MSHMKSDFLFIINISNDSSSILCRYFTHYNKEHSLVWLCNKIKVIILCVFVCIQDTLSSHQPWTFILVCIPALHPSTLIYCVCEDQIQWRREKDFILPHFILSNYIPPPPVFYSLGSFPFHREESWQIQIFLYLLSIWITHQCSDLNALLASCSLFCSHLLLDFLFLSCLSILYFIFFFSWFLCSFFFLIFLITP